MVEVVRRASFDKKVKHIKDGKLKERIKKQIRRIIEDPENTGERLRYDRKSERKIYIPPFRLIYAYDRVEDIIYLIDFDKRDRVYRRD
jgi:mRNA-degrading endonuclease RelE of RelBE toxin-antitoxin system